MIIRFDYELVDGCIVTGVEAIEPSVTSDGSFSCDLFVLRTSERNIVISINCDTDELVLELDDGKLGFEHNPYHQDFRKRLVDIDPILKLKSQELGWGWEVQNYRGYKDGFLLAFTGEEPATGLSPALAFIGEGGSISVYQMSPFRADRQLLERLTKPGA